MRCLQRCDEPKPASCPSLTTPTPTATANGHQITLSWTTGGGSATRYLVFRNETSCNAGSTQVATVNAPTLTYTDTAVAQGLTYYYRIQSAAASDSCVSPMSNCTTRRRPTASSTRTSMCATGRTTPAAMTTGKNPPRTTPPIGPGPATCGTAVSTTPALPTRATGIPPTTCLRALACWAGRSSGLRPRSPQRFRTVRPGYGAVPGIGIRRGQQLLAGGPPHDSEFRNE